MRRNEEISKFAGARAQIAWGITLKSRCRAHSSGDKVVSRVGLGEHYCSEDAAGTGLG